MSNINLENNLTLFSYSLLRRRKEYAIKMQCLIRDIQLIGITLRDQQV